MTDRFVPARLFLGRDRDPVRRYGLMWTPTLFVLDSGGNARAESVGVIPPEELLAFLDFGEAQVLMRRGKFQRASQLFAGIADSRPDSAWAADGLLWAGIADWLRTRDHGVLDARGEELRRRYPGTLAAKKSEGWIEG